MTEQRKWQSIEDFDMFRETERLCDEVWQAVAEWNWFDKDTVGITTCQIR